MMDEQKFVNPNQIPKSEGNLLGSILYGSIMDYFNDSIHQKEFEEWKKCRENSECTS